MGKHSLKQPTTTAIVTAALALCGCYEDYSRATIYYGFSRMGEPAEGAHYQHFATVNGSLANLGCFVVEQRPLNCQDVDTLGNIILRPVVVECDCPCTGVDVNPCDDSEMVTAGVARGVVNHADAIVSAGGVEFPTLVDLAAAQEIVITVEADEDDSPSPSADVLLRGALLPDGNVLRGTLTNPRGAGVSGAMTIVPVGDGVIL
jgi:hypothetical protein